MDETSQKIIDATMSLIRDKGYVATTTKDIAILAGVNECTLFRKFKNKKDIVMNGMEQEKWRGNLTPEIFRNVRWELQPDLEMFMEEYMNRITPDFVKLSIGLRAPQIYDETAPLIMKIPRAFVSSLIEYFQSMEQKGKLPHLDFEGLAMIIFSNTFGFTFLNASFDNKLTSINKENYIKTTVATFIQGIPHY
ncbi:TetR/AcrR family transcriptional regulator [Desulfosporosinus sp. OT]|uniref:TetR/AcrR family transcriptional regulator n=1 Tax=Desulfosporosinus sp. OT TaxID=913865 RepID=UPI0002239FA9|nr:TetR/AcrR family transcriptional regulator [Desulfosporosinus sp. OT]EGW40033.1 bacterial regulatory s, tetR family protein [Desulfosporosinus sp. OT]